MVRGVEKRHSEISIMIFANCCVGMYDNCQTLRLRQHNHYFFFFHLLLTVELKAYNQGNLLFGVK